MAAQQPVGSQTTIVARLLAWARNADADRRADAANALARAYLHSEFDAETRRQAELGLYALLDDPSPPKFAAPWPKAWPAAPARPHRL